MPRTFSVFSLCAAITAAWAQTAIPTGQYNQGRTCANLTETVLTTSNVNTTNFGLLFKRSVDDHIYAQPLYLPNVSISGGTHNVVYVATINNTVYAFDADSATLPTPLWQVNLGTAVTLSPPRNGIAHAGRCFCACYRYHFEHHVPGFDDRGELQNRVSAARS